MTTTIQVRINSNLKKEVSKIFESLGLDLSSGVKMFLNQVLIKKGIPFLVLTENGHTSKFEKRIVAQMKENKKLSREGKLKIYGNWEDMKTDILKESD
jgi:DNA-damage-inducible protein J